MRIAEVVRRWRAGSSQGDMARGTGLSCGIPSASTWQPPLRLGWPGKDLTVASRKEPGSSLPHDVPKRPKQTRPLHLLRESVQLSLRPPVSSQPEGVNLLALHRHALVCAENPNRLGSAPAGIRQPAVKMARLSSAGSGAAWAEKGVRMGFPARCRGAAPSGENRVK